MMKPRSELSSARSVLICGARGFLGTAILDAFRAASWRTAGIVRPAPARNTWLQASAMYEGDLGDPRFVNQVVQHAKPSHVVFVAGPSNVQQSFKTPGSDFESHVTPLLNVLEAVRTSAIKTDVVLVSSAAVYGDPNTLPVPEDAPKRPISPYGYHKIHQELLLSQYSAIHGIDTCAARVFSTYGPGLRHLAVWDIVRRARAGQYTIMGDGSDSRDFLHVYDVARAIESLCAEDRLIASEVNIASGVETTIAELTETIYRSLGLAERPAFQGTRGEGNPLRWRADVHRLRSIGFHAKMSLVEGIRETVKWIESYG